MINYGCSCIYGKFQDAKMYRTHITHRKILYVQSTENKVLLVIKIFKFHVFSSVYRDTYLHKHSHFSDIAFNTIFVTNLMIYRTSISSVRSRQLINKERIAKSNMRRNRCILTHILCTILAVNYKQNRNNYEKRMSFGHLNYVNNITARFSDTCN